ncbi:MAG: hypothetical protein HND57_04050 [Planctomycetes bacterium]|nr:hypothetical protein [Planctomycetota bacterium]
MSTQQTKAPHYCFLVVDTPYCVHGWNLADQAKNYLARIDAEYFSFIATLLDPEITTDRSRYASIAVRVSYYQCLEALFALLGALLQAPSYPLGWLQLYRNADLLALVASISNGKHILNRVGLEKSSWENVSAYVHADLSNAPDGLVDAFSLLWRRLAAEYVSKDFRAEYNSIKHGYRLGAGGFTFSFGPETVPGVPAAAEDMRILGGSAHGSTFYTVDTFDGKLPSPRRPHVALRQVSLNWSAEATVLKLQLASWSLNNVISRLRLMHGFSLSEEAFYMPVPLSEIETPWNTTVGVTRCEWHRPLHSESIDKCDLSTVASSYK